MFKSDTPSDINERSVDSVLELIHDREGLLMPSTKVRMNYVKMLYDVLGYNLSADVALALISEPSAELVLAPAGGGKTTWSQIKAIEQKLIRRTVKNPKKKINGSKILCLVYNTHNVDDMKLKHAHMVNKLTAAGIKGLEIDDQINATTMHSFCEFIRKLFVAKMNLVGASKMDDGQAQSYMRRAVKLQYKIDHIDGAEKVNVTRMLELYTLCKETLSSVDKLIYTDCFVDLGLSVELLNKIFTRFDGIKEKSRKYDFIDMLYKVWELLSKDESALAEVQKYYDYVIADEVQDFTPLMWEILRLFVNNGTPLTCIADEDQNIYQFRGASVDDVLKFKDRFPGGQIFTLSENRRCRAKILEEAKRVISENTMRFDKQIIGQKPGGTIRLVPYNSEESQIISVVKELKKLSADELNETVICYRNINCSQLLTDVLAEENIPMNCIKACQPYSHELYSHFMGVLTALEMPCDRQAYKCLWKVLPVKKSEFFEAIGFSPEHNKFKTPDDKVHFAKINYGKLMNYNGFADAIKTLSMISEIIATASMSTIYPVISRMLNMYFWNYKRSVNETEWLDDIFEKRVEKKLNVKETFASVFGDIQHAKSSASADTRVGAGVSLSTFHSLKGLEFKRVFVIDMDNDVFPNFPLIEYKKYPKNVERDLKEAETRLWYVAVTRAIDELIVYYFESNPSKYVQDYIECSTGQRGSTVPAVSKVAYSIDDVTGEDDFVDDDETDFLDDDDDDDFLIDEGSTADDDTIISEEKIVEAETSSIEISAESKGIEAIVSFDQNVAGERTTNSSSYLAQVLDSL